MFEWTDGYKLGLPDVDGEHLVLFSLINQLEINIEGEKAEQCVEDVLNALSAYMTYHFGREETLMREVGYPRVAEHIAQHKEFTATITDMKAAGKTSVAAAITIRGYVLTWLMNHILRMDTDYARHIRMR